jgi:Flp pilus assembly pilin Flp
MSPGTGVTAARRATGELIVADSLRKLWSDDRGQDIAEYALMLTVILLIVVAAVTAIGTNANTIFNSVAGRLTTS